MSKKITSHSDYEPLSIYSCIYIPEEEHLFICASSEEHAEELFIEFNRSGGPTEGCIDMEWICELSKQSDIKPGEVTQESLEAIGFVFLNSDAIPVFRYKGKVYNIIKKDKELENWVEESGYFPFPHVYLYKANDQPFTYKIGATKNLRRRYRELNNLGTPGEYHMVFMNEHAFGYESKLKKYLSNFSVANERFKPGEWGSTLLEMLFELHAQEFHCARPENYGDYSFEELLKGITELIAKCHGETYKPVEEERLSLEKLQGAIDKRRRINDIYFANQLLNFGK